MVELIGLCLVNEAWTVGQATVFRTPPFRSAQSAAGLIPRLCARCERRVSSGGLGVPKHRDGVAPARRDGAEGWEDGVQAEGKPDDTAGGRTWRITSTTTSVVSAVSSINCPASTVHSSLFLFSDSPHLMLA